MLFVSERGARSNYGRFDRFWDCCVFQFSRSYNFGSKNCLILWNYCGGGGVEQPHTTQRVFSTHIGLIKPMVNSDETNKMFWFQVTVPIKRDPWKIEIIEMIISVFCFHHNKQQPHNIPSTTPQQQPKDSPKPTILDCKLRHPILKFIQIIKIKYVQILRITFF